MDRKDISEGKHPMSTAQVFASIFLLVVVTTIGDYFLKLASQEIQPIQNKWFIAGCIVYALSALGWVFTLRSTKLATAGVAYSLGTILLLTALGIVVFGERLNRYEVAGIGCAILSIVLLACFNV